MSENAAAHGAGRDPVTIRPVATLHPPRKPWAPVLAATLTLAAPASADNDNSDDIARLSESFRMLPPGERSRYLTRAFAFMNVNRMDGYEPILGGGPRPDRSRPPLPFPSGSEGVDPLLDSPLQFLFDPVRLGQEALADAGLRLGIYELLVGQAVTNAAPGTRSTIGSSRFDLRLDALAWRPEGLGAGRVCLQFRQNNNMPGGATDLANSVGSVTTLDEPLSSISTKIVRAYLAQGFLDDRLTVTVGKVNPEDYIGLNVFASDETSQFLANIFDGNDVLPVAYQAGTTGMVVQALVMPWLYVNAQWVSAGNSTEPYFEETFGSGYFLAGEVGVILSPLDRPGRISFAWCASNENSTTLADDTTTYGEGWVFVAQQFLSADVGIWFQAAGADASIAYTATQEFAVGLSMHDAFGRRGDGAGVAFGQSNPVAPGERVQNTIEAYYRLQVTGELQVSLDVQALVPPAGSVGEDPVFAGAIRAKWTF